MVDGKFSEMDSTKIKNMHEVMKRGELDAKIVGGYHNDLAEVNVENYKNEEYFVEKDEDVSVDYSELPSVGNRVIPKIIRMDKSDNACSLNVSYEGCVREVTVCNDCTVKDFLLLCINIGRVTSFYLLMQKKWMIIKVV